MVIEYETIGHVQIFYKRHDMQILKRARRVAIVSYNVVNRIDLLHPLYKQHIYYYLK